MSLEIIRGSQWKDATNLDNLYMYMLTTIQRLNFQTVQKRIFEEQAAFTEVFIGSILYPIFKFFLSKHPTSANTVYRTFVEPVFVYFMVHENVTYSRDDAKEYLVSRVTYSTTTVAEDVSFVYNWALSNYNPHRSRYNKGKTTFMFYPKGTRSFRNLEKDFYIERLRVVVGMHPQYYFSGVSCGGGGGGGVHFVPSTTSSVVVVTSTTTTSSSTIFTFTSPPCLGDVPPQKLAPTKFVDPELLRIEREFLGFL